MYVGFHVQMIGRVVIIISTSIASMTTKTKRRLIEMPIPWYVVVAETIVKLVAEFSNRGCKKYLQKRLDYNAPPMRKVL